VGYLKHYFVERALYKHIVEPQIIFKDKLPSGGLTKANRKVINILGQIMDVLPQRYQYLDSLGQLVITYKLVGHYYDVKICHTLIVSYLQKYENLERYSVYYVNKARRNPNKGYNPQNRNAKELRSMFNEHLRRTYTYLYFKILEDKEIRKLKPLNLAELSSSLERSKKIKFIYSKPDTRSWIHARGRKTYMIHREKIKYPHEEKEFRREPREATHRRIYPKGGIELYGAIKKRIQKRTRAATEYLNQIKTRKD